MTIIWAESAIAKLEELRAAGGPNGSPLAARITRRVSDLERLPYLGSEVPDYEDPELRELVESPYRIIYRVHDGAVEVVLLLHTARKLPRTPPG